MSASVVSPFLSSANGTAKRPARIPGLVYALGRVAGHLWQAGE